MALEGIDVDGAIAMKTSEAVIVHPEEPTILIAALPSSTIAFSAWNEEASVETRGAM